MKISIISSSPRKESITYRVALFLQQELSAKTSHEIDLIDVRNHDFGFLQGTYLKEERTPLQHQNLRKQMLESNAFIFVSPEYNGGYSGALKNLVDHFAKDAFIHKPIGIVTASEGALGGVRAAMHLQQLICGLFGIPSPYMLVIPAMDKKFDASGILIDNTFQSAVDNFVREYLWLAERLNTK